MKWAPANCSFCYFLLHIYDIFERYLSRTPFFWWGHWYPCIHGVFVFYHVSPAVQSQSRQLYLHMMNAYSVIRGFSEVQVSCDTWQPIARQHGSQCLHVHISANVEDSIEKSEIDNLKAFSCIFKVHQIVKNGWKISLQDIYFLNYTYINPVSLQKSIYIYAMNVCTI